MLDLEPEQKLITKTDFTYTFECKADDGGQEVVHEGVTGVYLSGYMTVFEPRDRGGDNWKLDLAPGSVTRKAIEAYFKSNPIVLFEHGKDRELGNKGIGKTVAYRVDSTGIWVKDFIPKPPDNAGAIAGIYHAIKTGVYRAFSVAGAWMVNRAQTIVELVDLKEHSVVSVPMQSLATFSLTKSLALQDALETAATVKAVMEGSGGSLEKLTGRKFEIAFLQAMIEHHRAALEMAKLVPARTDRPELLQLGRDIITAQTSEITTMSGWLAEEAQVADKSGRMISALNAKKIRDAIAMLQALLKNGELPGQPSQGQETDTISASSKSTDNNVSSNNQQKEARSALNILQGVQTKMDNDKKDVTTTKPEGADNGNGSITLNADQAKAFNEMVADRENLKKEAAAKALAEKTLADEAESARKADEAKAAYESDVKTMAEKIAAEMRSGVKMNFGGNSGGGAGTGLIKPVNFNRGSKADEFSFLKFAQYGMQGREWQYMEQVEKTYGSKAVNESVGSQGGYMVPEEFSTEIVDLLRTQAVVRAMGVKVTRMTRDTLTKPRRVSGSSAYWGAEGSSLTTSQGTYGQIRFVARKLYCVVQITKEMMADSNPSIEADVREDIAAQMALAEDLAFLNGSGVGETPLGILNTPNVGSFAFTAGTASAAPEYKALVKAGSVVRNQNAKPNGIVMHSRQNDQIASALDTTGQPISNNAIGGFRWNEISNAQGRSSNNPNQVETGMLVGLKQALSNQIAMSANTAGTGPVIVGDWSKAEIGDRQDIEIEVDRSLGFLTDTVYIKATKRCDFVVAIPQAFVVITAFPGVDIA